MSTIRIEKVKISNYRSFGNEVEFVFPGENHRKPVAIVGYNNSGKSNLMNSILYSLGIRRAAIDQFSVNDFHKLNTNNKATIRVSYKSSIETLGAGETVQFDGYSDLTISAEQGEVTNVSLKYRSRSGSPIDHIAKAAKVFRFYFVDFHKIKDEISFAKSAWGGVRSILFKHLRTLIREDSIIQSKRQLFLDEVRRAANSLLEGTRFNDFVSRVHLNYQENLRQTGLDIKLEHPDIEDYLLNMAFRYKLEEDSDTLLPIGNFGDGYISMFVIAVLQSIAQEDSSDRCLFLFEEPESFLHENHQEYFYHKILCGLAEGGHQVIYTTHSDRLVDVFDTKGLIRIEYDNDECKTIIKYNNTGEIQSLGAEAPSNPVSIDTFNNFVKSVEPNLNKLLFGRKVLLVEGPNDFLVYRTIVSRYLVEVKQKAQADADTHLTFNNISILMHHGKATAIYLIQLCKHLKLDYFLVTDWDFENMFLEQLANFDTLNVLKESELYQFDDSQHRSAASKGMVTTNWILINCAGIDRIHFNFPRLEEVIGYAKNDKNSLGIWETIKNLSPIPLALLPESLLSFLELSFDEATSDELTTGEETIHE